MQKNSVPAAASVVATSHTVLSQMAGASHFMMLDPHTPQLEGFFGKPVDSLKVGQLFPEERVIKSRDLPIDQSLPYAALSL